VFAQTVPTGIGQALAVGGEGGLLEVIADRAIEPREDRAGAYKRRKLGTERPNPEKRPVEGEESSGAEKVVAAECVVVAEDLRESVESSE
jgi:hypothetical protein